ncbi:MAG TPA: response regulator [Gemmatimonadales bacterium]|nr:response regulator [Gemmatimonadales bacterium]
MFPRRSAGRGGSTRDGRRSPRNRLTPTPPPAILVVDDDPLVGSIITRALGGLDHVLLEAPDGLQARALVQNERTAAVRLVITDIRMPGMNGDDLGRLLRHLRPTLPVLYISGYSAPTLDFLHPGAEAMLAGKAVHARATGGQGNGTAAGRAGGALTGRSG